MHRRKRRLLRDIKSTKIIPMRKITVTPGLTVAVLLGCAGCDEDGFQKGTAAYESGDYTTALP